MGHKSRGRLRCRRPRPQRERPLLIHLTTIDLSLTHLLLPQLIAFREAGYDVVGVSAPGPHVAQLAENGISHVPLSRSTRAADVRADLAAAREFASICRELRPDIVHTHNPKPGLYGRIVARMAGAPVVVNTVHGLYALPEDPWLKRAIVYGLERIAASCSDAELVQNPEDLATLRRLGIRATKLRLLGNGVDLDRFNPDRHSQARRHSRVELGISDGEVVVGLVGRLVVEKGYREVFEAARRLRATLPHVRFVVAGPLDPDKDDAISPAELDEVAEESGIRFLGMRQDVERLYPAFDIYVLASHREGFPRSAMEAAAMGLPVIATNIRGCRQVVDDGRTGLLVPVHQPDALAAAVKSLADDARMRAAMGAAAREKALREFNDQRQIDVTLSIYERLLRMR